jgi:hypothetical protein
MSSVLYPGDAVLLTIVDLDWLPSYSREGVCPRCGRSGALLYAASVSQDRPDPELCDPCWSALGAYGSGAAEK